MKWSEYGSRFSCREVLDDKTSLERNKNEGSDNLRIDDKPNNNETREVREKKDRKLPSKFNDYYVYQKKRV